MAIKLTHSILATLNRLLAGATIGITVAAIYISMDYIGRAEEPVEWTDYKNGVITGMTLGILIGSFIGFIWGVSGIVINKESEITLTGRPRE